MSKKKKTVTLLKDRVIVSDKKLISMLEEHPLNANNHKPDLKVPEPELRYIKIPIIGSRTPEAMSDDISDLLCWFSGVEYATPEDNQSKLDIPRNGIRAIQEIQHYIKSPIK